MYGELSRLMLKTTSPSAGGGQNAGLTVKNRKKKVPEHTTTKKPSAVTSSTLRNFNYKKGQLKGQERKGRN